MNTGLLLCFSGAVSFGLLGCVSKLAERKNCHASGLVVLLFAWATLVMLLRTVGLESGFSLPGKAAAVAVACGICAAVAYYAFQTSLQFGKVSVAWLMMNLSTAFPAVASVLIYGEKLTLLKIVSLGLALGSLYCLFQGRRTEGALDRQSSKGNLQTKWALLMLIILLTNGMSAFGLKVIAGWGLPATIKFPYLTVWYAAGLVSIGVPIVLRGIHFGGKELRWSAAMAALSMGGQLAMAIALKLNVPGHIVFPVTIGGSVLIVTLGGRMIFGERMNGMTAGGVTSGFAAVVLLSLS